MGKRRKGMKLQSALKLYIALYVLSFVITWLISVPMLMHVSPRSECLLFVTPYIHYGYSAGCQFIGYGALAVACAAVLLIALNITQLKKLNSFFKKSGSHRSVDYHDRPIQIFWRMVVLHAIVTVLVFIMSAVMTAGYSTTCTNLHRNVRSNVRQRIRNSHYGRENIREHYDKFVNDRSIDRYTNSDRDNFGVSGYERGISCRKILTDPYIHMKLKRNHARDFHVFVGAFEFDSLSDRGNIIQDTYFNNIVLELCMAGCWISLALWLAILVLMVTERHHLKAHLTDESMWGSEYDGSRRPDSRLSFGSQSKMSQYSGQSRTARSLTNGDTNKQFDGPLQESYNGNNSSTIPVQKYINNNIVSSEYVSNKPLQDEDEVDVDAALEDSNTGLNFESSMDVGQYPNANSHHIESLDSQHRITGRRGERNTSNGYAALPGSHMGDSSSYKTSLGNQSRI